jgi:arylformamidase
VQPAAGRRALNKPTRSLRSKRRALLGGALAAVLGVALRKPAHAQQMQTHLPPWVAPKPKGPIVFLDYDQAELDAAYTQAEWAPNQADVASRDAQRSTAAVARLGPPRRLAYGPGDAEKLDLYAAKAARAPIQIFIHGGAWRRGSASSAAYQAEMYVDAGAHFIALDFNNVVETGGNLLTMARQVRRAVAWVYRNAESFGGDAQRIYVSGHSSGAHLAGVVLTTDWQREAGLPSDTVKGGLCASGMYDLHPVSLSARANYVKFTPEVIEALSSQRHIDKLVAPLIISYGTRETPEFQRQNREFAAAVKAAGKPVELIVLQGCNHFEVQESLGNPYGLIGRAVLRQMNLRDVGPSSR